MRILRAIPRKEVALNLMSGLNSACTCPAHSQGPVHVKRGHGTGASEAPDYAFEIAASSIRYGPGVTQEVGFDFQQLKCKKVLVYTDATLTKLSPVKNALKALDRAGVNFELYDKVAIEPTDDSMKVAIEVAKKIKPDAFLAVGGGSVMDTAKAANLYYSDPDADFLDYVNAPIGKGKPVEVQVKPFICIPTTSGTGSETTGTAVFDLLAMKCKTGISSRSLRPHLGILDPENVYHMPRSVAIYTGFDVFSHALESYTAIPYNLRTPRPSHPSLRPAYQGSNPISDVWVRKTLQLIAQYFKRAVNNAEDYEAKSAMLLAATYAGTGFGNSGCHLCHAMSYPVSGQVKEFRPAKDYPVDLPMVPHGLSVILNAPAVFEFSGVTCPERHIEAARLLGADVSGVRLEDAGKCLADIVRSYMFDLGIPNGLSAIGFTSKDVPALVAGALPQHRLTKLVNAPVDTELLSGLFENSLKIY